LDRWVLVTSDGASYPGLLCTHESIASSGAIRRSGDERKPRARLE